VRHALVLLFLASAVVLATSCKKKEGGACAGPEQVCFDKTNALACRNNVLVPIECAGPLGCSKFGDRVNCDTSTASAGAPCMGLDDEYACTPDKKEALVCKKGKFEHFLGCAGPNGCLPTGRIPKCDTSVSNHGENCRDPGTFACSADQKTMLVCRSGAWETMRYCRGQYGCALKDDGPACDESLSMVGDLCSVPGQLGCSTDGKSELICQGSVFAKSRTCKTGCTIVTGLTRTVKCE
jgi:hypothetical protein